MIEAVKPNLKKIILSIFFGRLTFITFLFVRNSSRINSITFKFNSNVEINKILLNGSSYLSNEDFDKYHNSSLGKFVFDTNEIKLDVTSNDNLLVEFDEKYKENIKIYYNNEELKQNVYDGKISISYKKSFNEIFVQAFKDNSAFINVLLILFAFTSNYIILSILSLGILKIKNKKEIIGLILLLIGLFLNLYLNYYALLNINKFLVLLYIVISFLILMKELFNFKINKDNLIIVFKVILVFLSINMLYLIPPFNIPDEGNHFTNSYSRLFYLEKDPTLLNENGKQQGTKIFSKNVYKTYVRGAEYQLDTDNKINYISYFEDMNNKINKKDLVNVKTIYGTYTTNKLAYIPSNVIIWLCKLVNTPVLLMFLLARFINLLLGLVLIFKALDLLPKYKYIFMFVIALPLTIHQSIGVNQDWLNNALFFLYIAYLFNLIFEKKNFTKTDFIILLLIAFGIANTKTIYTPAILLILLVDNKKFKNPILTKISLIFSVIILTFIGYIGFYNLIHPSVAAGTSSFYTISDLIKNPILYIKILINTFKSSFILNTVYGLYTGFGVCKAWLVGISTYLNYLYILFILTIPYEKDKIANKIMYLLVAIILYLLVNTALLVGWTDKGAMAVWGLHPRYFIPVVLLGFMFVNNKYLKLDVKKYEKILIAIIIFFNILGFLTILKGLYI